MKSKPTKLTTLTELMLEGNFIEFNHINNDLNKAIYMLHFVNEEEIFKDEVKEVCLKLHSLSQRFFDSYMGKIE